MLQERKCIFTIVLHPSKIIWKKWPHVSRNTARTSFLFIKNSLTFLDFQASLKIKDAIASKVTLTLMNWFFQTGSCWSLKNQISLKNKWCVVWKILKHFEMRTTLSFTTVILLYCIVYSIEYASLWGNFLCLVST